MKFLLSFKIPFTIVVTEFVPHRYWWVELNARCSGKICLGTQCDLSLFCYPHQSRVIVQRLVPFLCGRFACLGSRCRVGLIVCFVFCSLQTLPRVPKLFTPCVACPRCSHPNDEDFNFCQKCGYIRRATNQGPLKKFDIDEGSIAQRVRELNEQRSSSRYSKQKSALELEFRNFLRNLSVPKSLSSALPSDVIAFLVWKDGKGRTRVHRQDCHTWGGNAGLDCECPKRLAFGTVDSLIGKLRAIFAESGRGAEWQSLLGVGNPASCRSVKNYLSNVREEQLKARVTPRQAEPILVNDLLVISEYIRALLLHSSTLRAIQIFMYARDQALFKALFFAGDRAADLLQVKVSDVLRFSDNSGLLFNHVWTKSLRSGDANVFAFKRGSNPLICPVRGLEMYFDVCKLLRINLAPGFLFRSISKSGGVCISHLESSAAQARLSFYVSALVGELSSSHLTVHGFRSGAAVSLALRGVSLSKIMDHIGWKSSKTALHYIKLKQVVNPAGAAAKLADLPLQAGQDYKHQDHLVGF